MESGDGNVALFAHRLTGGIKSKKVRRQEVGGRR